MKIDLLIQNGWVYQTYRQSFEKMDLAVVGERFYDISPSSYHRDNYEAECVVDAAGKYIIPGLIDIRMHIESSMTYPEEFSRVVLPYGVTCVVADCHEIANVYGVEGIKSFMEQETELDIYYGIPYVVPSTGTDLETLGGQLREEEIKELLKEKKVICLGETMNPALLGESLVSLTPDVVETVVSHALYENVALVTGDTMPDHLVKGHLNQILRLAVEQGMPAEKAIYCATLTPARRTGLDDRGMIAPGKLADFVVLDDLVSFSPSAVYKNGKKHEKSPDTPKAVFPDHFYQSIKCRLALASDFSLNRCEIREGTATVHVMQIQESGTRVRHVKRELPIRNKCICWQEAGLCLAVVFERYGKTGDVSYGLVEHALKFPGAIATTWSRGSHNLLVLGNSPKDMVLAQNRVVHMQGGYVTAREGKITASVALPVGGIISDGSLLTLSMELAKVREEIEAMGYGNSNVIRSISTLTYLTSPELKISDKGLYDVRTKEQVPLVEIQEP